MDFSTRQYHHTNIIHELGKDIILTDEVYITFEAKKPIYHYYLKDHLSGNRVVIDQAGKIEQTNHYYPYGGLMGESTNGGVQAYKYNGKELQRDNGLDQYYYGARMYDATVGRWTTMDPLCEKYYNVSPYAYCFNNPIHFMDIQGKDPGDFFDTIDAAAIDFGNFYNDNSIREGREYGSTLFMIRNKQGKMGYTYTVANPGQRKSVVPSQAPFGVNIVASIHTHGTSTFGEEKRYWDNEFSGLRRNDKIISPRQRKKITFKKNKSDIGLANDKKLDAYLVTPNGSLQKYDYQTGLIHIISKDMPSDKNDPTRLNNKSSWIERNEYKTDDIINFYKRFLYENF